MMDHLTSFCLSLLSSLHSSFPPYIYLFASLNDLILSERINVVAFYLLFLLIISFNRKCPFILPCKSIQKVYFVMLQIYYCHFIRDATTKWCVVVKMKENYIFFKNFTYKNPKTWQKNNLTLQFQL
ncbi:hypothetical protein GOODEAATRI_000625 [Goodea atripinnis]|uniref:Uncharacterized protein n=1 Tax=Goodea atripinnis TaxID=208336 RepID=A0ABV0P0C3_9TELE